MTTTTALRVEALPGDDLARIRRRGMDDFGNPVTVMVVDSDGGTPLRCCLREARIGERITLIAYRPSKAGGPYAEVGPVIIHADACEGYAESDRYPDGFRHRQQLLRAYSADGRIVDATIAENGEAAEVALRDVLPAPRRCLHSQPQRAVGLLHVLHPAPHMTPCLSPLSASPT